MDHRRLSLLAGLVGVLAPALAAAQSATPASVPAVLPEVSDVATLPPAGPHRVWLSGGFMGGAQVIDGDSGELKATIAGAALSSYAAGPGQKTIYVAESIWSKGVRGERQDMITVYDGSTLKLATEIPLPSRAYLASTGEVFSLNASGTRAYVFSMQPAASEVVVDLVARKVLRTVDTPGCALAFAWGEEGLASLCGDGSLTVVTTGAKPTVVHGKPFFDAERDPVFELSPTDAATGKTLFVTYSGVVHPATLGPTPQFDAPWSLSQAAGLPPAGLQNGDLAWRPGGNVMMAWHHASNRLYVLMHPGEHWTQKKPGEELWVVDTAAHKVLRRLPLDTPCGGVAVSQDDHPQLYLVSKDGDLSIRDAQTLEEVHKVAEAGGGALYAPGS